MATTVAWIIMDGPTHADEGTAHEYAAETDETDPAGPMLFDAIVVRYQSGNDRCTLVPRNGSTDEKLNAWLTADLETVVDLDDAR
ncbi:MULTISPECIES: DUF7511 domain-containing protein [Natrinema]|uniref:DUF7511 domain-containing protein n=3 Tax=Natrinema TaxID=88723 RepID=L9ZYN7_NATA2|nr:MULTISPECIES: hypothetical protein [Natrinema]AFO59220.1 hypothetical protein NJ7G_4006 [Natrinema sp. J7-2]ELY77422.1 hypothetical protein C486_14999 [Natrinema gari JCM 14663]ELY90712.1 hypothetical protein C485_02691 [Natrinema altunense JCM 12890]QCW04214.1 hypothetical protein FGF80_13675 [Natrinema pallidum]